MSLVFITSTIGIVCFLLVNPSSFNFSLTVLETDFTILSLSRNPSAEPTTDINPLPSASVGGFSELGLNAAIFVSQVNFPPQCDHKFTTGDQPPDIATTSTLISSSFVPVPACSHNDILVTLFLPETEDIAFPFSTRIPKLLTLSASSPPPFGLESITIGTDKPASFKERAVL